MNLDVISYKLYNWYMYIDTQMLGRAFTVFLGWGGGGGGVLKGWVIKGDHVLFYSCWTHYYLLLHIYYIYLNNIRLQVRLIDMHFM